MVRMYWLLHSILVSFYSLKNDQQMFYILRLINEKYQDLQE